MGRVTTGSRRLSRRQFIGTSAAAVGAFTPLLAACGGGGSQASGGGQSGKATVRVWTWYTEQTAQWPQLVKEFQKLHPNITVENRVIDLNSYLTTLEAAVAAGDPPEIFGPHVHAIEYGQAGVSLDLRQALGDGFLNRFFPSTNASFRVGGKQFALGWEAQTFGLFYNPEILDKAGVQPPATWDDLIRIAPEIRGRTGAIPCVLPNQDNTGTDFFLPLVTQATDDPSLVVQLDEHTRQGLSWKTGAVVQALQMLDRLVKAKVFEDGINGVDDTQGTTLLYSGRAAMLFSGSWKPQDLAQSAPADFVKLYRVAPTPAWKAGKRHWTANQAGAALGVSARSRNVDAALDFIRFLYEPARYAKVMNDSNSMPATTAAAKLVTDPAMKQMTAYLTEGNGCPHILFGKGSWDAVTNGVQALIGQSKSPQAVASTIEAAVTTARGR